MFEERRVRNMGSSLFDCLQFCDKRDLVITRDDLRETLGLGTKPNARRLLRRAEDLRNHLAHSQPDLVRGSSWRTLIQLVEDIERFLHRSDDLVVQRAQAAATMERSLWPSQRKDVTLTNQPAA